MAKLTAARKLAISTVDAQQIIARFRDVLADDDQAVSDIVEGETDLFAAMDAAVARIAEIEALAHGIRDAQTTLAARKGRLEAQSDALRRALQWAMEIARLDKHEAPTGTVSVRACPPALRIVDESLVPAAYLVAQPPKLNKRMLLDDMKAVGVEAVPGVELSNGSTTIAIRFL